MTPGLVIRRAGLADVKAIGAIEKLSFPTPWSRWAFMAELGHRYSHTLVAGPGPPEPFQVWGYLVFWVVADEPISSTWRSIPGTAAGAWAGPC